MKRVLARNVRVLTAAAAVVVAAEVDAPSQAIADKFGLLCRGSRLLSE
jgi:hypothetical protein